MAFFGKNKYVCCKKGGLVKGAAFALLISALLVMGIIASSVTSGLMQSAAATELTAATDDVNRSSTSSVGGEGNDSELKQYALQRINEDRAKFDISQVSLGDNMAAQIHAEDILKTRVISHFMTNGEKPYMTYSRLGGEGAVAQNVATSGYPTDYDGCISGALVCDKTDPRSAIDRLEYNMMNIDKACCNDGHRNNILDRHHTHVDIGIAYDDYFFVMVQNFEDRYTIWTHRTREAVGANDSDSGKIVSDNNENSNDDNNSDQQMTLTLAGSLIDNIHRDNSVDNNNNDNDGNDDLSLANVQVYYDKLPTSEVYKQHRNDKSYELGELVALVVEPPPSGTAYKQSDKFSLIEAQNWQVKDSEFDVTFSLQELRDTYGEGVYTIVMLAKNSEGELLPASETSFFVN